MPENAEEPTMEEILASIRRIISEDEPAAEESVAAAAPAPTPPTIAAAPRPPLVEYESEPLVLENEILDLTDINETSPAAVGNLDLVSASTAVPPSPLAPLTHAEHLISQSAAGAAASVFDILERTVMMPQVGRSLEEVIREMLRPMLKAWLDENLPTIVEAQVAAEVERIARQRR